MYLGIEIGGTKLQLGIGPGDGTLEALWRGKIHPPNGSAGIRAQILSALPELFRQSGLEKCHLHAVGIGFGGPVDDGMRTVIKSHQIEGWDQFPLAEWIEEILGGVPAVLGNDADVAGLGEALFGAGKGLSPIFYITIGSGIGGGLVVDGEIYRGSGKGAAEIGHLRVSRPSISGIRYEKLEDVASGWGIESAARSQANDARILLELAGGRSESIRTSHIAQAARLGDEVAREVLANAWECLAEGICHVIALLCPQRIIIGGGVSKIGEELLFQPLRKLVAERVFKPFADCYDIVPAALGEEVVVHGALALARKRGR